MKITAFKTSKPKQYKYNPLFYNERKEELEKLKQKYADNGNDYKEAELRDRMRSRWQKKESKAISISQKTFIVYIIIAALLIYFMFFK